MADVKLTEDLNVISNSNIEIEMLGDDLNIIQKLDDEPNDVGGMSSAELKATFDKSGLIIQKYINETLIPEIIAEDATEESRKQAEAVRVAAEQGRVTAEEGRVSAETAREQAETARQSAETARSGAESTRQSKETARQAAETARANAETARASAESERRNAESSRVTAEGGRASAEASRVTAEGGRASAEASRVSAEQGRTSAESTRVQDEQKRVSAENGRVEAEAQRAAAEQARADENTGIVAQATAQANAAAQSAESASASAQTAQGAASTATNAASSADQSATSASGSASQAQASAAAAAQSAASVDGINKTAQSWAVGGTNTRPGEDTDNAKYWAKRAEGIVSGDVFYVDLQGNYNASTEQFEYTIAMTQDQLTNAYTSGKSLVCRFMIDQIPCTLPLIMVGDQTGMWVFSGAVAIDIGFDAQTFTVALVNMGGSLTVVAQRTQLAIQTNLDEHVLNDGVHVTKYDKTRWDSKAVKAHSFTVTLTAAGWSGNAQVVSNKKFYASGYAYTVCPAGDSFAGYAEAVIYADDVTTEGKMTFHCSEKPTANLTVNILRMEATA